MADMPRRGPRRIGPWRPLHLLQVAAPLRAAMFGGDAISESGAPDAHASTQAPDERPGSDIREEQRREPARRILARRAA